jgi:hypothetical protein
MFTINAKKVIVSTLILSGLTSSAFALDSIQELVERLEARDETIRVLQAIPQVSLEQTTARVSQLVREANSEAVALQKQLASVSRDIYSNLNMQVTASNKSTKVLVRQHGANRLELVVSCKK